MIQAPMNTRRRPLALAVVGVVLGGIIGLPAPASARVWVGFGFPLVVGPPAYYPPPVYYPPPAYYPPPPAYYPQQQGYYPPAPPYYLPPTQYSQSQGGQPSGQSCNTGGTVCPMERPTSPGSACYCTTAQGRVWGRAN